MMRLAFGLEDIVLGHASSILSEELRELFRASTNVEKIRFAHRVMTKGHMDDARYAFAIDWIRKGKMTRITTNERNTLLYLTHIYERAQRAEGRAGPRAAAA